jgi:predicted RNA-binding Zn ribbon-like protein
MLTDRDNAPTEAPMLGDHLAMDLLNTEARADGELVDYWQSADDVRGWLERQGVACKPATGAVDASELLAQARTLRTLARSLITQQKQGKPVNTEALNTYLHAYPSAPHLGKDADGRLVLTRLARAEPVAGMLGPVAEAVAQLLAEGDFALVKQCAHPECILWFYDRTKSHKRRWCSMALCGNRYKAAQFRKKAGADA